MTDEKKALESAMQLWQFLRNRPGANASSPLVRQLEQVIKVAFKKEGGEAVASARREAVKVEGSKINALRRREKPDGAAGKRQPTEREARLARRLNEQQQPELTGRQRRIWLREQQQGAKTADVSEVEGAVVAAVDENAPMTPQEMDGVVDLSAQELISLFGTGRIDATLEQIGEKTTGTERQRANRLLKSIKA